MNFLRDNWQFISSALLAFLTIISMIIKKKPVNQFVDEYYQEIASLIGTAEKIFGSGKGAEKKQYVKSLYLLNHPSVQPEAVDGAIEDLLSLPTKKKSTWSYSDRYSFKDVIDATSDFVKGVLDKDGKK